VAKVTQPLGSSEARGALGGFVYNTWRGISTVRTRVTPLTEYSDAQIALRILSASCTARWKAISQATRDKWAFYAKNHLDSDWTGNPKRLSGYNWFLRINVRILLVGGAIVDTPPTYTLAFNLTGFIVFDAGPYITCSYTYVAYGGPGTLYNEYYAAGPYSAARNPTQKDAKRIGYSTNGSGGLNWIPPIAGYYHIFTRPVLSNGVVGQWSRDSCYWS
jgi:hypothetical protein